MSTRIAIYQGPDFAPAGTVGLAQIVQPALERLLRVDLSDAAIQIVLLDVPDDSPALRSPTLHNLLPDFGYAYVTVRKHGRLIYQHPHTVGDIVGVELQTFLRDLKPAEQIWGFRIAVPSLDKHRSVRPTPEVEGAAQVQAYAPGEGPSFEIRRVAEDPPPEISLHEFGRPPDALLAPTPVKVILSSTLYEDLNKRPFSGEVEEGGFLLGRVFRESDAGGFLIEVTSAENAEYTGASFLHFTFTGDSFSAVKQVLRTRKNEKLAGWYHTHLFAATDEMGLSSIDFRLHFETFSLPWQVAGLINIEADRRVLRFYVRKDDGMALCPVWVVDEERMVHG